MSTKVKSNTAARRGELPLHIHGPYGELLELRCVSGITFSLIRGGFKTRQTKPCILDTITILAKHLQYHKIKQLSIGRLVCWWDEQQKQLRSDNTINANEINTAVTQRTTLPLCQQLHSTHSRLPPSRRATLPLYQLHSTASTRLPLSRRATLPLYHRPPKSKLTHFWISVLFHVLIIFRFCFVLWNTIVKNIK